MKITVTISKDGNSRVDVVGGEGSSCKDATKEVEAALGVSSDFKKKREYHSTTQQQVQGRQS